MMEKTEYFAAFVIKICIERFFKKHLKSRTHTNNIREREQLNKAFQVISQYQIFSYIIQ